MTKLTTLKDLMIANELTMGEVRRLTRKIFNGNDVLDQDLVPYIVTVPMFDDLPDHVQQFLIKAVLESSIVNVMDADRVDPPEVPEYENVIEVPENVTVIGNLYRQGIDNEED